MSPGNLLEIIPADLLDTLNQLTALPSKGLSCCPVFCTEGSLRTATSSRLNVHAVSVFFHASYIYSQCVLQIGCVRSVAHLLRHLYSYGM